MPRVCVLLCALVLVSNDVWLTADAARAERQWEDWELPSYLGFGVFFVGMVGGWFFKKQYETPSQWAKRELELRKEEAKQQQRASSDK
jgi:hypothetical protein